MTPKEKDWGWSQSRPMFPRLSKRISHIGPSLLNRAFSRVLVKQFFIYENRLSSLCIQECRIQSDLSRPPRQCDELSWGDDKTIIETQLWLRNRVSRLLGNIQPPPLKKAWTFWSYLPANQEDSVRVTSLVASGALSQRSFGCCCVSKSAAISRSRAMANATD